MSRTNQKLADIFDEMADLLEIQGENPFRVNAHRRAARALRDLSVDVAELAARGELTSVEGIGKGIAERIEQYLKTGQIPDHQALLQQVPAGLPRLLEIPGFGPKKAAAAWKKLGVTDLDALKQAIEDGRLAKLPGFGAKSVQKIAEGIAFLERTAGRVPLGIAAPIAERLLEQVRQLPGVRRCEVAGSLRRGRETIGDVDLLCNSSRGEEVIRAFTRLEEVEKVLAAGDTKASVVVATPGAGELQVDLRVIPEKSFGAALQYFTGSKEHNVRLREMAVRRKWRLNEYGLFSGKRQLAGRDEEGIYEKLGVPCVPPEMREDRGEFEAGERAERLVRLQDIRGDLHVHTVASDGRATIEEMAEAARALGYAYLAICDHSRSSTIANGLSVERMEKHLEAIRRADKAVRGITILAGCECDILADGSLDYPDDLLAECDLVVASIHSGLGQDRARVTRRTCRAMENPYVTIIGHPTGRLIHQREPMDIDMNEVIRQAAATGTWLEVNASWQRLDLKDVHVRQAVEAGVRLVISTDAHSTSQLEQMRYGVMTARRGWATRDDVINTRPISELRRLLRRKRGRA